MRAIEEVMLCVYLYVIKNNKKEYLTDENGKLFFHPKTAEKLKYAMKHVGISLNIEEVTR